MTTGQIYFKALQIAFLGQAGAVLSMILEKNKINFAKFLLIFHPFLFCQKSKGKHAPFGLVGLSNTPQKEPPTVRLVPPPKFQGQRETCRYRVPRSSLPDQAAAVAQAMTAALVFYGPRPCDMRLVHPAVLVKRLRYFIQF